MKKKFLLIALTVLLGLVPTAIFAQGSGLPGSGWQTGQQVQNVGNSNANIQITAYDANGSATYSGDARTLNVGASTTYLGSHFNSMPSGFIGSAVVSSDQPALAIVNETNGTGAGQYQGTSSANTSTTLSFPLAKNSLNGKSTTFYIQNAGTTATTMTATFKDSASGATTTINSPSVEANRTWVLILGSTAVPSGSLGSLTVTSGNPLAGVVNEHSDTDTTILQSTRGFGANDADSTIFAPIFKQKFNGRSTGMQVQNTSNGTVDITMNVKYSDGTTASATATGVAGGASATFFNGLIIGGNGGTYTIADGLGSATFTATGGAALVGIVNETTTGGGRLTQTTYSMAGSSSATTKSGIPLYKETFGNKGSGIQVQNTSSSSAATVNLELQLATSPTASPTTYTLSGVTIPAGSAATFFRLDSANPIGASSNGTWSPSRPSTGTFGGVTVTADQAIIVIVQEVDYNGQQDNKNYEGFPLQ